MDNKDNKYDKYYKYKENFNAGNLLGDTMSPASSAFSAPIAMFFSPSYYLCCCIVFLLLLKI
jgi:hypothetical protein